jgi:hypothetical protein
MENRTYHTMDKDKSAWKPGPWQDEPDKEQFSDPETGFPCLVKRNSFGALCGYVGVAAGHPWYEKDYDDVDADVHGGLTYSNFCQDDIIESHSICHVPDEGEPEKVWWLGFDCGHYDDVSPQMESLHYFTPRSDDLFPRVYKTFGYVKAECALLARQAMAAEHDNVTALLLR